MEMINKNIIFNQEITTEEKSFKINMFDYFYYILNDKNKTSLFTLYLFYFCEIIQLISFAFSNPHLTTWKTSVKAYNLINIITSGFRLFPLIRYAPFNVYIALFIIIFILIFVFCLLLLIQIIFRNANSKIYSRLLSITHMCISPLTIFLYIPMTELLLVPLKCGEDNFFNGTYSIKCWSGIFYIFLIFGIIGALLLFFCLFFLNCHYFYPFQTGNSTMKLTSSIDLFLLEIKFIFILKYTFIKNESISIAILLILSFFLLIKQFTHPIYNIDTLELILNLRNILIFWTYFMLLIAKLCFQSKINKLIYLLVFGYPIIIFSYVMFFKEYKTRFDYKTSSFNNINACLIKTRFLINIIDSFIEDHKNNIKYSENINQKNDILLKGIIQMHTEICLKEDCP
jgi:hypothetical protein